jgi:hypothetical protein
MPRNMSFALTTEQFLNRTKTVTRRLKWKHAKAGDIVNGCRKCMGLRPGQKVEQLGQIQIVSATPERLIALIDDPEYGAAEAAKEGFPGMSGVEFVAMFVSHMRPDEGAQTEVTRIEYKYI